MNTEHRMEGQGGHEPHDHFVEVSISTTAGFLPGGRLLAGSPSIKRLDVELQKSEGRASRSKIPQAGVASVITPRRQTPGRSCQDVRGEWVLSGELEIDWGPSEGGGG